MGWRSGQSYGSDLRSRVLGAVDAGRSVREVAALFRVSVSYVYKALARRRRTGETGGTMVGHDAAGAARLAVAGPRGEREPGAAAQHAGPAGADAEKSRDGRRSRTGRTSPPDGGHGEPGRPP